MKGRPESFPEDARRQPVRHLSQAELRAVPFIAGYFAYLNHQRQHPDATEEQLVDVAYHNWRQNVDRALDFLAIRACIEEQEARRN